MYSAAWCAGLGFLPFTFQPYTEGMLLSKAQWLSKAKPKAPQYSQAFQKSWHVTLVFGDSFDQNLICLPIANQTAHFSGQPYCCVPTGYPMEMLDAWGDLESLRIPKQAQPTNRKQ